MQIQPAPKTLIEPIESDVPTLFIHGEYDSVTPLSDVTREMTHFKNAQLLTFEKSHSVLDTNRTMQKGIVRFVAD